MNNKYKFIKYKAVLFFATFMFLSMSALIMYLNIKKTIDYKNGNIIKIMANIDDITYYQYGIKKRDISYIIYSFEIDNSKYYATNIYNGIISMTNKNTEKEIYYDKINNEIIELQNKSKIFLSIFFFVLGAIILIWAIKLKQNNIHTWNKL
ncbi:hypothetical protein [uncultured Brachyspira sp.]|uniref:hypothetical protein n=1 Tax=uncultured Brachyspira sp. TaxID=221953 RepID=UPI002604F2E0|nr:hypothetical protein [uncultured Brachyspira sp.]